MSATDCPEDLLVRERQGILAAADRGILLDHATTCPLCRLTLSLGRAIEPLPSLDTADDLMVARMVERTLAAPGGGAGVAAVMLAPSGTVTGTPARGNRGRTRPRRYAVAAALVLIAGTASAAWWRWSGPLRRPPIQAQPPSRGPAHSTRPRSPPSATVAPPSASPSAAQAPLPAPAPPHSSSPGIRRTPRRLGLTTLPARPARSAAALFLAANEARRTRAFDDAGRLYQELQRRFPGSPEAALSFLSLGDLFLSRGHVAAALGQFEGYLASGDSALAEEALVGRARALARLGRTVEEQVAWQTLLARYPHSDYRWRAQQRLDDLHRAPR
jgi:TolA-binding protein